MDEQAAGSTKYKKAPDAPKRFKSAFISFSAEKHCEISKKLQEEGRPGKTTDIAKLVSEAWKQLSPKDREEWELKAEQDRARFEAEKVQYKGPWKIKPAHNKRAEVDTSAPKRPLSAFLCFAKPESEVLKSKNPHLTSDELNTMLSKSWKELSPQDRAGYMNQEAELRAQYKTDMCAWRKKKQAEHVAKKARRMEVDADANPYLANALAKQAQLQALYLQLKTKQQKDD